jgi:succinoglycan biosynthesis protein ExoO
MAKGSAPQVSVIIPAWNVSAFLPRAVASVLAQRGAGPVEIVIVDDCSSDTTVAVAAELAAHHPEITLLRNSENSGPARSRNLGIAAARGDWVAVLDADDAYAPDRLARLTAVAEAETLDIVADLPALFDLAANEAAPEQLSASGEVTRLDLERLLQADPETGLDLGLLKPIFRRELVLRGQLHYPEHIRHGEDHMLYVTLLRQGLAFGLLREAHYIFSTRIGAVSGRFSPGSVTRVNYRALARQSSALAADLAASGELTPVLEDLLKRRQAQSLRQNRAYGWTVLRQGNWSRLLSWLGQHPANGGTILAVACSKLAGHRGPVG